MIAKPVTYFDDQGLLGWIDYKAKFGVYGKQKFFMEANWKDVKYYGEGTAYCQGQYTDLQNYYFSKIIVKVDKPRKEEYVILDDNTIDI